MGSSYVSGGSSTATAVMEMSPAHDVAISLPAQPGMSDEPKHIELGDGGDIAPTHSNAASSVMLRWNTSRRTTMRIASCFWSFVVMGANDGSYGALIPYIESYYNLSYLVVSLIFLSPFIGYVGSALLINAVHERLGQRGVAFLAGACHVITYLVVSFHPPYPVLVVLYIVAGFGQGFADAGWNAFIGGSMANATELLGLLHGLYGFGAVIGPLVATAMITKGGLQWYSYYYVLLGMAAIELVACTAGFWTATGAEYRASIAAQQQQHQRGSGGDEGGGGSGTRAKLKLVLTKRPYARVTWLCALFLIGYVGAEVSLGGWIVTFMMDVRHGGAFASGIVQTGFWLGIAVGRVVLGFVTPRIGVRLAIAIYLTLGVVLELIFWLVPQFVVSAVAIGLQGFFMGPLFPAAIVAMGELLPRHLHVGAIGFIAALGGSGAAALPFAVGAIAQAKGVQVLQPIILAILVFILVIWMLIPRFPKKKD
ncbi:major facilitator superfamily domain-containing protein [Xylariales sp. PMI_506]|nr:major facilitator superfamily domain-containing protein [Xylariales sp. PMI_506]